MAGYKCQGIESVDRRPIDEQAVGHDLELGSPSRRRSDRDLHWHSGQQCGGILGDVRVGRADFGTGCVEMGCQRRERIASLDHIIN